MSGLPTEPLSGHCARRWLINAEDVAKEPEVLCRDGLGRQVELAADDLGDRAHGVALVGDGVSHRAGSGLFENEAEELGRIEAMHGWPPLGAVADVAGDPSAAGGIDEHASPASHAHAARQCDERVARGSFSPPPILARSRMQTDNANRAAWNEVVPDCAHGDRTDTR